MNEKRNKMVRQIEKAKGKIRFNVWTVDFAKGFCYGMLHVLCEDDNPECNDMYNEFAKEIDVLGE